MSHPLYIVDAFTRTPFTGNPAAVCVLDEPCEDAWKQRVAAEMNLSETAFVQPLASGAWRLQWFTPAAEVELCGHATLASAHLLWETGRADPNQPLVFETVYSGKLTCTRREDDLIAMDFPADPPESASAPAELFDALGIPPSPTLRSRYDWIVVMEDALDIERVDPDFVKLRDIDMRGVAVTAAWPSEGMDFISRFFAPRLRIAEDPVTGSLHCALGPYWSTQLGKLHLHGYQASPRGGHVYMNIHDQRVELAGHAVTVTEGHLRDINADPT